MNRKITRSTVNEEQYSAPQMPTSGFPLSYRRYSSWILGRIHVAGFQYTMPGDKISGSTRGMVTFNRLVTPIVSPVNAMQYNVYLPFRPLDRSFKKGITPTKKNAMSANWSMPLFNTRYLVEQILFAYFNKPYNSTEVQILEEFLTAWSTLTDPLTKTIKDVVDTGTITGVTTVEQLLYTNTSALVSFPVYNLQTNGTILATLADNLYMRDALLDIAESITAKLGTTDNQLSPSMLAADFVNLYLSTLLTPWIGRYSYYAEFKYEFVRPFDFYRVSRGLTNVGIGVTRWADFINMFSNTPQNEYAIRAMYAIWYELFRNVDLEPDGGNLPDWQDWSSTSIFDMSAGGNLCYLLYRIRPWEKDMFISAQIDDLSRHVYAPILSASAMTGSPSMNAAYHDDVINNYDAQGGMFAAAQATSSSQTLNVPKPAVYKLTYYDDLLGLNQTVSCPVPSNINDVLSSIDENFKSIYGLDLNTLRQSQMLERYLKRNYLFGDEYQDRMLAHYNSRVSDHRINKPEILSQSMDEYNMGQEVSNVSTDETKVGDRTATATVDVSGSTYTTYCEEFGIMVSIVCFMPRAMYDGTCPQAYLSKCVHLPIPEFAANNEEFGRKTEIAGSGLAPLTPNSPDDNRYMFGRYPAYHAWRSRVDEVGGVFLDEMQDSTYRRFFGMFSDDTTPKLNYFFIHCRPNLNMFANNILYDTQLYGDLVNECFVERVLPVPVETI